jgi:hypothetical protein
MVISRNKFKINLLQLIKKELKEINSLIDQLFLLLFLSLFWEFLVIENMIRQLKRGAK